LGHRLVRETETFVFPRSRCYRGDEWGQSLSPPGPEKKDVVTTERKFPTEEGGEKDVLRSKDSPPILEKKGWLPPKGGRCIRGNSVHSCTREGLLVTRKRMLGKKGGGVSFMPKNVISLVGSTLQRRERKVKGLFVAATGRIFFTRKKSGWTHRLGKGEKQYPPPVRGHINVGGGKQSTSLTRGGG